MTVIVSSCGSLIDDVHHTHIYIHIHMHTRTGEACSADHMQCVHGAVTTGAYTEWIMDSG